MKTEKTQTRFLSDVLVAVASLDLKVPKDRCLHEKTRTGASFTLG